MKLKHSLVLAVLFLSSFTVSAQKGLSNLMSTQGDAYSKVRTPGKDDFGGSVYLYKNWDNNIIIKTPSDIFKVKGGNYNVQTGSIELTINKDSTFVLSPQNTGYIRINGDYFKFNSLKNRELLQVVYESPSISLYKRFFLVISNGSYNPLTGKSTPNKYKARSKFVLNQNGTINDNFKPKRKTILKLFPQFKNKVKAYAKKERLSYRKEKELRKILSYAVSLQKK